MAQDVRDANERGAESDQPAAKPGEDLSSNDVSISNDWARRRLDLYERMEHAIREEITHALRTAAEIRTDVERDAEAYLRRLNNERARIAEEVATLQRERQQLGAEIEQRRSQAEAELHAKRQAQEEELRRQRSETTEEVRIMRTTAEEEASRLRTETQASVEQMLQEAETRRAEVAAEVRALEEQVVQIQGVIDSFLNSQIQTLRGSLGTPPARAPGARGGAAGAEGRGGTRAGSGQVAEGAAAGRSQTQHVPGEGPAAAPRPSRGRGSATPTPISSEIAPMDAAPAMHEAASPIGVAAVVPEAPTQRGGAVTAPVTPPAPSPEPAAALAEGPSGSGAVAPPARSNQPATTSLGVIPTGPAAQTPASPAPAERQGAAEQPSPATAAAAPAAEGPSVLGATSAPAGGVTQTSVVISGVSGFSSALALQRAIQQVPGVREAKAVGYERGVLGLELRHEPTANISESVTNLPGIRLRVLEASTGSLQLSAES